MKRKNTPRRHVDRARPPRNSPESLHWLQRKNTLEKQAAEQLAQDPGADSRALMVWADDGGRID
jgi:hypothetical protein